MSLPLPLPPAPPAGGLASVFGGFWGSWVIPQYGQQAIWFQRITSEMPGATPTAAWDLKRAVTTSFNDGSYGVGWQLGGRKGYLAPKVIQCAKDDNFRQETVTEAGLIIYQGPIVIFQPSIVLRKQDILVFSDGRYAVGDEITPAQVMGQTVVSVAKLEERSLDAIEYTIPLS